MLKKLGFPLLIAALLTGVGACQADREAAQLPDEPGVQPDFSPHPQIEQAPAYPTPPVGVPIGAEEEPTEPADTFDPDTMPRLDPQAEPDPGT